MSEYLRAITNPFRFNAMNSVVRSFSGQRLKQTWREIENAFENIRNACEKALQKKYTGGVPDRVRERLDEELGYLKESCFIEEFEHQRRLFEEARKSSNLVLERAVVAGSFIYHLMGDTKANPLPAHYYCPKCGHYEEAGRGIFGIDLPKEKCPECGGSLSVYPVRHRVGLYQPDVIRAREWISRAELVLVIGTNSPYGGVYYDYIRPSARIVRINPRSTAFDSATSLNIREQSDIVFKAIQ